MSNFRHGSLLHLLDRTSESQLALTLRCRHSSLGDRRRSGLRHRRRRLLSRGSKAPAIRQELEPVLLLRSNLYSLLQDQILLCGVVVLLVVKLVQLMEPRLLVAATHLELRRSGRGGKGGGRAVVHTKGLVSRGEKSSAQGALLQVRTISAIRWCCAASR